MKLITYLSSIMLLAGFSLGGTVQAQTMDFESFTPECGGGGGEGPQEPAVVREGELFENGLQLSPAASEWCVFNGDEGGPGPGGPGGGLNDNGSNFLGFCGSCEGPNSFTLTREDGAPFDLQAIDLSSLTNQPQGPGGGEGPPPQDFSTTFQITGFPAVGPPIVEQFTYEFGVWATYPLSGMLSVESVEITLTGDGFDAAFDNIVTAEANGPAPPGGPGGATASIPTGSTLGMLLMATLLLLLGMHSAASIRR